MPCKTAAKELWKASNRGRLHDLSFIFKVERAQLSARAGEFQRLSRTCC
jgi:hypothetical protein